MIISSKAAYEISLTHSFSSNPKKLYNRLSYLPKSKYIPKFIKHESALVYDPLTKAKFFYHMFNSTFTRSNFDLPTVAELPSPMQQLSCININTSDVYEALAILNHAKATKFDDMSPKILKFYATSLVDPV